MLDDVDLVNVSTKIAIDWRAEDIFRVDWHGDNALHGRMSADRESPR